MNLNYFHVAAFTPHLFKGNPACVIPLTSWLEDEVLQAISKESALPETAFFVQKANSIQIRWFTPDLEMDLCGHATLAAAHCLKTHLDYKGDTIEFESLSGRLSVTQKGSFYHLDLPTRLPLVAPLPKVLEQAITPKPSEVLKSRDYVLVYSNQECIKALHINRAVFDQIHLSTGGVVVTAPGEDCDFVSRYFTPQATILEDPVTGSSHCSLVPYWAKVLGKNQLLAKQLSERGGELKCYNHGDCVEIAGEALTYAQGVIFI